MYRIYPFEHSDEDYSRGVNLRNQVQTEDPTSEAIWRYWDDLRSADSTFQRLLVEDEKRKLLAFGEIEQTSSNRSSYDIRLHMEERTWMTEIPRHLYSILLKRGRPGTGSTLTVKAREDQVHFLSFLKSNGYALKMRSHAALLEVGRFSVTPFEALRSQVTSRDIQVCQPPHKWTEDPIWKSRIYDLYCDILRDIPHPAFRPNPSLQDFMDEEVNHPNFLESGYFLALDGSDAVGMSSLVKRGGGTRILGVGLTGVIASHRRKGIASALKIACIEHAEMLGTHHILTDNEQNNPMYALNQKLGFTPLPAWNHWVKQLGVGNEVRGE
jgi:mycothiol synthase